VPIALNTYAEAGTLMLEAWDVVIVATGGTPAAPAVPGAHLVHDTWDLLAGATRIQGHVAVYDDHGGNQALDAAEALVRGGATVEIITPERRVSPDVGSLTATGYFHAMAQFGTTVTGLRRLLAVTQGAQGLTITLGVDGIDFREERVFDAVVAEMGTEPVRELYDALLSSSTNLGAVDLSDLLALRPQSIARNPDGRFQIFRIGDAIASRNVHAAMLDAARLCRAI
jgi:pyruvate/2-oxoglutarate dehydrogenase complex dihydrolipoamide dehydrogenase (E3) component